MNLAICEDNPQHYEIICSILRDLAENTFQTCHFSTGNELLETISNSASSCPYSIILMDIDLGENSMNGIALADQINKLCPDSQIIFISQYLQYATAVYETEHVYFIHKLQIPKYLPLALQAACRKLVDRQEQYLYFSMNSRNYQVQKSEILYLERNLRQTIIHTRDHAYTTKKRLHDLAEQLKPDFCRCHNSFCVNLHAVCTYSHQGIQLSGGYIVPVSRSYYQSVKDSLAFMKLVHHKEVES